MRVPSLLVTFFTLLAAAGSLLAPAPCQAQMYRPEQLQSSEAYGATLHQSLSYAAIQQLNTDLNEDIRAMDAFGGRRRGIDRFPRGYEANGGWKLYGRVYLLNFANEIERSDSSTRFTWRRTGPGITKSRIYVAFTRRF
jgi:hypothetical protein